MDDFSKKIPSYFKYWGKAKKSTEQAGAGYHLLPYHCLDVAAVGQYLLSENRPLTKDLAMFLELTPKQVQSLLVFFLVLHDLGKFTSAFQQLFSFFTDERLLQVIDCKQYDGKYFRHDRMGLYFWQQLESLVFNKLFSIQELNKRNRQHLEIRKSLMVIMDCMLGHHGLPIDTKDPGAITAYTEPTNMATVEEFFHDVVDCLQPDLPVEKFSSKEWRKKLEQVSWQIAGLAVLADWVGSDSHFFTYQTEHIALKEYWSQAQQIAQNALTVTDLIKAPIIKPFKSIQAHYGYEPTPLQSWAETVEINNQPQLFILEDVTGSGKTEAALALTHRLMQAGAAEGFYFGLPTMATSNAMFARVAKHYQQMLASDGAQPSIVLAHGAREMNDIFRDAVLASGSTDNNYHQTDSTATAQCNQWLADSKKKALLAPVGVGTIDQALLAVLPRRHQSLRLLGLNRKVLIFDEVHAADEFMFELLESLLALHLHQGGSAILLTATLSFKQRQRLVNVWLNAGQLPSYPLQQQAFPLATKVALHQQQPVLEQPLASRKDVSREVAIATLNTVEACIDTILTAVEQGQCVVWVRNTVDDALAAFYDLQDQLENPEDCLLFHSRFVLADRKNIENKVLSIFGKQGDKTVRKGKVLIATQVFQESLDADADVMITDICPIDDLIQRAGRLHRHTRDQQGRYQTYIQDARPQATLYIHAPEFTATPKSDWLSKNFLNTQYVYRSPGRLWLGLRELLTLGAIRMPSEARQLIEAVYSDDAYNTIPETLTNQENQLIGEERSKAAKAKSQLLQWQQYGYCAESASGWHEDNSDISTRHSDIETVEVLLLKQNEAGELVTWIQDEKFAVALSTVKMSKHKFSDKLQPLPASFSNAISQLEQKYKQIKYLQLWLPEFEEHYTYHSTTGFCQVQKQEVL
jgi:CRISPR-associated endonuclease/helicase Cas3